MRVIILTLLLLVAYPFVYLDRGETDRFGLTPPERIEVNDLAPSVETKQLNLRGAA